MYMVHDILLRPSLLVQSSLFNSHTKGAELSLMYCIDYMNSDFSGIE